MEPLFTTNEIVAVLAAAAILAVFAAGSRYLWRLGVAAIADDGHPRFTEVVRRLGVNFGLINDAYTLRQAALGVRRCLTCRHQEACDAWLADRGHKDAPPYCPNGEFLRQLTPR